ncbi:hypothetical protein MtrunA17_Chr1g0188381 [Medicago truncatula]|uniref:Uncharacterized protein n=1 Tax=Medicago truncatula TaxID=3880 RepID=A0A396JW57_MEDTR|nr:hypothetical protein MtrunA17_Chr1g0188381 [Medicago truncatula]
MGPIFEMNSFIQWGQNILIWRIDRLVEAKGSHILSTRAGKQSIHDASSLEYASAKTL